MIDPQAEFAHKISALKRRIIDINARVELLAESQEIEQFKRRLEIDLRYIDYTLLRSFKYLADTAFGLLQSLLEEKQIKTAIATCLAHLDSLWNVLSVETILTPGRHFSKSASLDEMGEFFGDVVQSKLLPQPVPLTFSSSQKQVADDLLISRTVIWDKIEKHHSIESWPEFVVTTFHEYSSKEQLKAIALPLTVSHPQIILQHQARAFQYNFAEFHVNMSDFGLIWENSHGHSNTSKESEHLSKTL